MIVPNHWKMDRRHIRPVTKFICRDQKICGAGRGRLFGLPFLLPKAWRSGKAFAMKGTAALWRPVGGVWGSIHALWKLGV
jgi:hypothetical protein